MIAMTAETKPRWFRPTADRLLLVLLAVEGFLWLSARFRWFAFSQPKGYAVLAAVACAGVFLATMFLWFLLSRVFRRRLPFSGRSLAMLTLAVALPGIWLATAMIGAIQQREAVASLLKAGGKITYDYQRDCLDAESQPPAPDWLRKLLGPDFFANVREVDAAGKCDDALSKQLRGFAQLRKLGLLNCPITDAAMENIEGLTQLQVLDLRETKITDAGLKHLEGLSQLQKLYLFDDSITDAGMESLAKLSQLDDLEVSNTKVSELGLEKLKGLTHFRTLGLGTIAVSDAGLRHLEAWPELRAIYLQFTDVSDAGLKHFKGLTQLEALDLHATHVTGTGLDAVKTLPHLSWMELGGPNVTNAALEHLKGMTQLRSLEIGGPQITDAGLAQFEGMTQLQSLQLMGSQVGDAGLEHLKGLTQLQRLDLDGTQVSDAGLKHLEGLTQLRELNLRARQGHQRRCKGTSAGIAAVQDSSLTLGEMVETMKKTSLPIKSQTGRVLQLIAILLAGVATGTSFAQEAPRVKPETVPQGVMKSCSFSKSVIFPGTVRGRLGFHSGAIRRFQTGLRLCQDRRL